MELFKCPNQPGNLLISKENCVLCYLKSNTPVQFPETFNPNGNNYFNSLDYCRNCNIGYENFKNSDHLIERRKFTKLIRKRGKFNIRISTLPKRGESIIYFLKAEDTDRIKIGYSKNVRNRLRSLKSESPVKLRLVTYIKGDIEKESEIHSRFERYRIGGEWFKFEGELKDYILNLKNS